jgi:hypothetical protein
MRGYCDCGYAESHIDGCVWLQVMHELRGQKSISCTTFNKKSCDSTKYQFQLPRSQIITYSQNTAQLSVSLKFICNLRRSNRHNLFSSLARINAILPHKIIDNSRCKVRNQANYLSSSLNSIRLFFSRSLSEEPVYIG